MQRPDADAAAGEPLLAFVHIPRTGGGTLSSAISKNYAPQRGAGNFQKGPDETRKRLENIAGKPGQWKAIGDHVPYGVYVRYLPGDTRYITVLRDPVDRVLSHYHFHARAGEGDRPGAGARKLRAIWEMFLNNERLEREGGDREDPIVLDPDAEYTLEEGLRRKIAIYDNFMTRFLWGGESLYGELPPAALERAKENLASFWFVGLSERLDDSIILLGRRLGVGLMPYWLRHVSQQRPSLDETAEELRALIAEHNALDVELYRFARRLFEDTAPAAEDLAGEAEELRRLSIEVSAEGDAHKAGRPSRRAAKLAAKKARDEHRASIRSEKSKKARRARSTEEPEDAVDAQAPGRRRPRKAARRKAKSTAADSGD
jgi:hypothetical protein